MPEFMDVHHGMVGLTADGLMQSRNAVVAAQGEEGVDLKQVWADPEGGIVYCLCEAPSADAVQRLHEKVGMPYDEIHAVPLKV